MKKRLLCLAIAGIVLVGCKEEAATDVATATPTFESSTNQASYGMGLRVGQQVKETSMPFDSDSFVAGLTDGISGAEPKVQEEQIIAAMQKLGEDMQKKLQAEKTAAAENNKTEGATFLAANGAKDGVVTTDSGLQYKVLTKGEGTKPSATSVVEVNYRGTLIDGTEFDSSYTRGETAKFPVNAVIAGWTEALQLMPVGSKWELYIPSELAYGPAGSPPIGPNATLIFEVDLIGIEGEKAATDAEK
ncbi:FKBP-type peptidyl-prolyl cis-trans isomerase FkpA/FKBP-type peptidyl-prolyl cis-trans isomerase FklB [Sinobacterium caligoides]|uniref:Peptidyl-prolyl cis-trans isomerase n=1 Tax=Sinobacterium caligoides TaxID=933926 RepID=A0A3N2DQ76_9GAMM|nr:FKBP-type peptidyl-prolyl cis-trans isomerase [Sinobacterium caligoides]ROS01968.1 FKBP-type peptidyl-prolyl cis-trans isomerase FkpA/FKBP-type peptidyl-prolyl cis-trans isomerase FklB [Sinobacterium caligoides]